MTSMRYRILSSIKMCQMLSAIKCGSKSPVLNWGCRLRPHTRWLRNGCKTNMNTNECVATEVPGQPKRNFLTSHPAVVTGQSPHYSLGHYSHWKGLTMAKTCRRCWDGVLNSHWIYGVKLKLEGSLTGDRQGRAVMKQRGVIRTTAACQPTYPNQLERRRIIWNVHQTHTHTHNRFTALWNLSGTTRVSRYQ